jgi:hypothetical protein
LERRDRVVIVVGAGEERRELEASQLALEPFQTGLELPGELGIDFVLEELVGRLQVSQGTLEPLVAVDLILQPGEAPGQPLASGGVVPERWVRGFTLDVGELGALALDVKGTPWRPGCGRGASRSVRCDRSCARF